MIRNIFFFYLILLRLRLFFQFVQKNFFLLFNTKFRNQHWTEQYKLETKIGKLEFKKN